MRRYRRTPKNYDGTGNPAKPITTLLPSMLQTIEEEYARQPNQILEGWKEIIGEKFAPWTHPLSFKNGVLTVKVKSSTLYSLLAHQEKKRLLKSLQKKFSKQTIRDLQFKNG